jgi:hypothetical protein
LVPSRGVVTKQPQNSKKKKKKKKRKTTHLFSPSLSLSLSLSLPHSLSLSIHRRRRITEKVGGREIQNGREPEESAFFLSFSVLSRLNLKERKDFHLRHSRGGPGRRRWRDDGGTD